MRDRAVAAYKQTVVPALSKLHQFLVTRYLPACRETTDAASLPDGAALYAYNVQWHTTLRKTPQEIHEIGLAEVKRIRTEMDQVMAQANFKGSYEEFKEFLRTDPRFYFKDAESLLTAYRDIAKRADPELAHLFGRLPQTPYGVKKVPDAICAVTNDGLLRSGFAHRRASRLHVCEHVQARFEAEMGNGSADAA